MGFSLGYGWCWAKVRLGLGLFGGFFGTSENRYSVNRNSLVGCWVVQALSLAGSVQVQTPGGLHCGSAPVPSLVVHTNVKHFCFPPSSPTSTWVFSTKLNSGVSRHKSSGGFCGNFLYETLCVSQFTPRQASESILSPRQARRALITADTSSEALRLC